MKRQFSISIQCLLFSFCSSASIVYAETKVDAFFAMSPAELAAIPVSIATGTPKPVFQSAAVTSVITAEQIKAMGATELHEVLETVPGIHASLQELTGDYNYSVRGIKNATNSQVLFLLNGTRITTSFRGTLMIGLELPIDAISKIEVIRGPGSALYGADAFAGVINIITKKSKEINGATLGSRIGDHDNQSEWGQYSTQWAGWNVASSLQYQHSGDDDSRIIKADNQTALDNVFGTHASKAPGVMNMGYENINAHLNLQRKHWDIGFWAFSMDGGLRAGAAGALDPKSDVNGEQYGVAYGEQYVADAHFSTEDWFENWELTVHGSNLHYDLHTKFRPFPANSILPIDSDANVNFVTPSALVLMSQGIISNSTQVENIPSMELSSIYRGLTHHQILMSAGFRYEDLVIKQLTNFGSGVVDASTLLPPPNVNVIDGRLTNVSRTSFKFLPNTHRSVWSVVAQDEWQLANDWQLTTGVRYDDYSDFGSTVNPRAALIWAINNQLTSKFLYGRAFRAPNFSELGNQNNPVQLGNKTLNPEHISTYEWAFDYRPLQTLRVAANFYYYQIEDLIMLVPDAGKLSSTFQNSGNQDGFGSELEWNWQVLENWNLLGNYAWQDARNNETNSRITGVPEHHIYAATIWRFLPQWQLQPQLNWISGRTNALGDYRKLPDYATVDLTFRGKKLFKQVNLTASLRNAFDASPHEPAIPNLPENLPMPGRSFYFEASIDF